MTHRWSRSTRPASRPICWTAKIGWSGASARAASAGLVPPFHVDNLMVQLDSIRAQQDELAARDGGLNHTTRTFIESRLARLERNVTW